MGIFDAIDKISKTVNQANKAMSTVDNTARTAQRAKGYADKAGQLLEKKCSICKTTPLKTDIEKQKGVCVNCAMARM